MNIKIKPVNKKKITAWAVHGFTASGIVLGFLAIVAILNNERIAAFLWLGLALFIDGIDGTLARKAKVNENIPNIDGSTIDIIVDYFTYVIIPALMIYWFGMVPPGWEIICSTVILSASLYTFANINQKTHDFYFSGFPALWNIVVLYFYIIGTPKWVNFWVIFILIILTFIPIKYVHPLRVQNMRNFTLPITVIWAATSLRLVTLPSVEENIFSTSPIVYLLWILSSLYFLSISLGRSFKNLLKI